MRRRSIHRAFVNWLGAAESRLKIAVQMKEHTRQHTELSFDDINPAIGAILTDRELGVCVEWQGWNYDCLTSLDVKPRRAGDGYVCELCKADERTIFPDLEALWRGHLFEPFLQWVNEKLAAADAIGLYGSPPSGWTFAELLSCHDARGTEPDISVPLRVSDNQWPVTICAPDCSE
jgi:hypothetical protein